MATIGIIGSGNIGGTVAHLAVAAGYDVVVSNSRGPETLTALVDQLGPSARAATREDAAAAGDLVVVSVPLGAYPQLASLPLAGKVVMDTGNYYPSRDGKIAELDSKELTDSEQLARFLPGARVVKVFNNIYWIHLRNLARPAGATDRTALPIAGDDVDAKAAVTRVLDELGYDTVDAGPLAESWRQQMGSPAYGEPFGPFDNEQGSPADAATMHAALDEATR